MSLKRMPRKRKPKCSEEFRPYCRRCAIELFDRRGTGWQVLRIIPNSLLWCCNAGSGCADRAVWSVAGPFPKIGRQGAV